MKKKMPGTSPATRLSFELAALDTPGSLTTDASATAVGVMRSQQPKD